MASTQSETLAVSEPPNTSNNSTEQPDHNAVPDDVRQKLHEAGLDTGTVSFAHHPVLGELPRQKKGPTEFEFAEHSYLGDTIMLKQANGTVVQALTVPFTLDNGLTLTYGQINGLAGDFYGTEEPISDGTNLNDQVRRFQNAYNTLSTDRVRQPAEANALIASLQSEVQQVNQAIREGRDPAAIYQQFGAIRDAQWVAITSGRPAGQRNYATLALINFDHFGDDARTTYNAGHYAALQIAARGTPRDLLMAYAMNAFADHFLEDSFSAGHLRTPRRRLHEGANIFADQCAKYMHDEDNAIGLDVQDPSGNRWHIYGDKDGFDNADRTNITKCKQAVQTSADEIYECWRTRTAPPFGSYKAWNIAPTLASARAQQRLAPLFTADGSRRSSLRDNQVWSFTTWFTYATTVAEILTTASAYWSYPINLR